MESDKLMSQNRLISKRRILPGLLLLGLSLLAGPGAGSRAVAVAGVGDQEMQGLLTKVRAKVAQVHDYSADARMKIDVSFMKVPESAVKVYFETPDIFRIKKEGGISILPKGGVTISLNALLSGKDFAAIDAGRETIDGLSLQVVKLVPLKEAGDVVLTTLYIDDKTLLVRRAVTTTRNNGTYEISLEYGRYATWALPDKAIFTFNTSGYKLPKGLALEYDPGDTPAAAAPASGGKGQVILTYSRYVINKGVSAEMLK
jgi:hypothetical protein